MRGWPRHLKNSCEINLGMGLLAMIQAWKGIFGEKGLGHGTQATVNNTDSRRIAGEDLTASAVPRQLASSTEPPRIRNNSPGPGPAGQLPARRRARIDFTCGLTAASASELEEA